MYFRIIGAGVAALALSSASGAQAQSPDLDSLHDALHLTAGQEDAWRAYKSAIAPDPSSLARHRAAAQLMVTLSTPRRVDLIDAEMSEDLATTRRQGEAVKAFYNTLTPDQQRTFDHQTLQGSRTGGGSGPQLRQPPSNTLRQPGQQP